MRLKCVTCGSPGQKPFSDVAPYQKGKDKGLCRTCAPRTDRPADYRNPTIDFRKADSFKVLESQRFVGIEFEMFHKQDNGDRVYSLGQDWRLRNCGVSEDGSIHSDTGIEIKTPPAHGDDLVDWINGVCEISQGYGMRVDKSCGLHVHTDVRGISASGVRRLLRIGKAMEPIMFAIQPKSRLENSMTRPLHFLQRDVDLARNSAAIQNLWSHHGGVSRYTGFNLKAIEEHGSVEFRYHAGTLNPNKVRHWAQMCQAVVDAADRREFRSIPYKFTDFDDRLTKLTKFIGTPDLLPYLRSRIAHFGHDLKALEKRLRVELDAWDGQADSVPPLTTEARTRMVDRLEAVYHHNHGASAERNRSWCRLHSCIERNAELCTLVHGYIPPSRSVTPGRVVFTNRSEGDAGAILVYCDHHGRLHRNPVHCEPAVSDAIRWVIERGIDHAQDVAPLLSTPAPQTATVAVST